MREFKVQGYNQYPVHVYLWDNVESPKAIVQLSHGMAEHLRRYNAFAEFLNSKGFIVIGDDHRAHGRTSDPDKLGIPPKKAKEDNCFYDTVEDMRIILKFAKQQFNNLPVFLLGHSYGSFLTQAFIQKYSGLLQGCILSGTAAQKGPLFLITKFIADTQLFFSRKDKPAKLLTKLGLSSFDVPFREEKIKNAWLSRDRAQVEKYNADKECGFMCSFRFYSSMASAFTRIYKKRALEGIRKDLPLLIICGDCDPVGSQGKNVKKLESIYKATGLQNMNVKLYPGARHEVLNETNKKEVYDDILTFLNTNMM